MRAYTWVEYSEVGREDFDRFGCDTWSHTRGVLSVAEEDVMPDVRAKTLSVSVRDEFPVNERVVFWRCVVVGIASAHQGWGRNLL